jgi:hypothetical protein
MMLGTDALVRLLSRIIDDDRYPLSPLHWKSAALSRRTW